MTQETVQYFNQIKLPDNIKLIILDFDNTCYLYEPCHKTALEVVKIWFAKEISPKINFEEKYREAQEVVKKRIPNQGASHSRILYFKNMLESVGNIDSVKNSLLMENMYWKTFIEKMKPVSGLIDFLTECKEKNLTIAMVSDLTTTIQCEKITSLGISQFVDVLVTSEEAGAEKPDPICFKLVLEKTQRKIDETVVIGDSLERDILGAKKLGTSSILIIH
jgi:HAD superfamily hydrolase (TIGR01509 family)